MRTGKPRRRSEPQVQRTADVDPIRLPCAHADDGASRPGGIEPNECPGASCAAERYAALRHAPATVERQRRIRAEYERWCTAREHVPYSEDPSPLALFIADAPLRGHTARHYGAAIDHAHRAAGFPEPTRDPAVRRAIQAGMRARTHRPLRPPVGVQDVIAAVASLDPEVPMDARNGAYILLQYAGGRRFSELMSADRSRTTVDEDGVSLGLRCGPHFVCAGSSPATCPAWWTARWLRHVGTAPGPLFPALNARGGWSQRACSRKSIQSMLARVWERAGIAAPAPLGGCLRRGFATAAVRVASPVIVAHQLALHSVEALRTDLHVPGIPKTGAWAASRRRARRSADGRS